MNSKYKNKSKKEKSRDKAIEKERGSLKKQDEEKDGGDKEMGDEDKETNTPHEGGKNEKTFKNAKTNPETEKIK